MIIVIVLKLGNEDRSIQILNDFDDRICNVFDIIRVSGFIGHGCCR